MFEYMPKWVKKDIRVQIFYNGKWYPGIITSTPKENDRGVEVKTREHPVLSIPVYMTTRSREDWDNILKPV